MKWMGPCDLLWSIKKKDWYFHSPLTASDLYWKEHTLGNLLFSMSFFPLGQFSQHTNILSHIKNSKLPYFFSCPSYYLINFLSFHGQIPPFYIQYFTFLTPNHFSTAGSGVSSHHPIKIISYASYQ